MADSQPLGLFIQPACLQHKYIRHASSAHIFERPERLRAVLLGIATGIAHLEQQDEQLASASTQQPPASDDLSSLLSSLSIGAGSGPFLSPNHLSIVPPPVPPRIPGQILQHHPALQLVHSPPPDDGLYSASKTASSSYLRDLFKWATEAVDKIKETGCEIPSGLGLNQGDLYLGPGSILAIEGAVQTVCQAIDKVCAIPSPKTEPATPPVNPLQTTPPNSSANGSYFGQPQEFSKAFCAIRPPGHHCGEDLPSGFCYVNNVVVGALHAYLEHDIDRTIIIDFDLHHGNGTQALVMPLNAASYADDLAIQAGKPALSVLGPRGKPRRNWKGFYGSYSYPCEDGDIDLIKDASISLAAHGQYIENIHLQPYSSEQDFYERIYPKYLALLEKAKRFMQETQAEPDRTIVLISAGFDACEHEHQAMQRHDRRVPTSFFSTYTRDIAAFADTYTGGKIVSVLEGGYSDRALTSAAMGHSIGMLGKKGDASWWAEKELITIEKAIKKKRGGKLAPLAVEHQSQPHLVRAHALLAHFEGSGPDSVAPSAATTPQGPRRGLRDRKKPAEQDLLVTPPAPRRGGRSRSAAGTPRTPRVKEKEKELDGKPGPAVCKKEPERALEQLPPVPSVPAAFRDDEKQVLTGLERERERESDTEDITRQMESLGKGALGSAQDPLLAATQHLPRAGQAVQTSTAPAPNQSRAPGPGLPINSVSQPHSADQTHPKIILRIPRIPSMGQPAPSTESSGTDQPSPTQPPQQAEAQPPRPVTPVHQTVGEIQSHSPFPLYPSIPPFQYNEQAPTPPSNLDMGEYRRAGDYREGSATSTTSGEYKSAVSEVSEGGESVQSLSSGGYTMPGKF